MGPGDLAQVLRPLRELFDPRQFPNVLVGLGAADDAAVYRLNDQMAIIATSDFFPPVVDDPYAFGAVAAANAMSDVYAMGGEVLFALNLVAFPENVDLGVLSAILRGGAEKVREAGGAIAGGHTITEPWSPSTAPPPGRCRPPACVRPPISRASPSSGTRGRWPP